MRLLLVPMLAIALSGVAACAADEQTSDTNSSDDAAPRAADARGFVSLMQDNVSYEFDPASGPRELRDRAELVVQGTIKAVSDGQVIGTPREGARYHVVIAIDAAKTHKSPDGKAVKTVHLQLPRPDDVPAARFQEVLPAGSRIVVFADRKKEAPDSKRVTNRFAGRAAGATLFGAHPQGLFVEVDGEPVSALIGPDHSTEGFRDVDSFDELEDSIEQ